MLKKWFYKRWLRYWAGGTTLDGLPNATVKKRFDATKFYVDLYWVVKIDDLHYANQFYYREHWSHLFYNVHMNEKHVVHRVKAELKKIKR